LILDGAMPGCPRIHYGVVDVRDVVDLHIRAMTHPLAEGERFIASTGDCVSLYDVAKLLRSRLGAHAKNLPRFQLPNWLVRLAALRDPRVKAAIPHLGVVRNATAKTPSACSAGRHVRRRRPLLPVLKAWSKAGPDRPCSDPRNS
jgi:nucleoside-diphosphate-sugar epimerase